MGGYELMSLVIAERRDARFRATLAPRAVESALFCLTLSGTLGIGLTSLLLRLGFGAFDESPFDDAPEMTRVPAGIAGCGLHCELDSGKRHAEVSAQRFEDLAGARELPGRDRFASRAVSVF
jgi:hypothetical protein